MTSEKEDGPRRVFRISGADWHDFLQNLVTNDLKKLADGPVYTALLTPQGKLIADFLMIADGDGVLLDVAEVWADMLKQRLSMYRLRADVLIEDTDIKVRRGTGDAPEGAVIDPRSPALGWRLYGTEDGDDGSDFVAIRVAQMVPESGVDLGPDSYILEMGFDRLNGVDFRKGCYVGQEVTARMKHKTELRKGLRLVHVGDGAETGAEITRDGKTVGTLLTVAGDTALAYLRFDRVGKDMMAGGVPVSPLA
jgi:hypothetical protein